MINNFWHLPQEQRPLIEEHQSYSPKHGQAGLFMTLENHLPGLATGVEMG